MHVTSVNVGHSRPMANAKRVGRTGIYKLPVSEPVQITADGLVDDAICDVPAHGGVDQAVYVYGAPEYAWWSGELEQELAPGTFGENVTIAGFESAKVSIGDRLHIGAVILEVTAPRMPCVTLARRMDDPAFLKRFREAERPGVYCRVIQAGFVQANDAVTLETYQGPTVTVIELFRDEFDRTKDVATIHRQLAAPVSRYVRGVKEKQLQELAARDTGDEKA